MDQVKRCYGLYLLNEHSDYVLFPIILVHKAITQRGKLWPWKEWLKEHFELILFKFACYSHKLYIKLFHTLETYHLSSFFQLQQNVQWTDEMTGMISASTGINGVNLVHIIVIWL